MNALPRVATCGICAYLATLLHCTAERLIDRELQCQLGHIPQQGGQKAMVQATNALSCNNALCSLHAEYLLS